MANLLYVDDEEAIGRAVRLWLTRKGHVVHLAHDAASARAILASTHLDGVFIDVWLGSDSGLELFHWLEQRDPALAQRVAFVTGDLFDQGLNDAKVARPVFTKPFQLRELEDLVLAWLGRSDGPSHRTDAAGPSLRP